MIVAVAVAGILTRDLDFGVEFTGGRLVELATGRPIDPETARTVLAENGFPRVVVQESGDGDVAVRSGELDDADVARIRQALTAETGGPRCCVTS